MISPERRTVVTERHEFRIPLPASGRDVQDTISQALTALEAEGGDTSYDDAVKITAENDDTLIVYWEERS